MSAKTLERLDQRMRALTDGRLHVEHASDGSARYVVLCQDDATWTSVVAGPARESTIIAWMDGYEAGIRRGRP